MSELFQFSEEKLKESCKKVAKVLNDLDLGDFKNDHDYGGLVIVYKNDHNHHRGRRPDILASRGQRPLDAVDRLAARSISPSPRRPPDQR